MSRIFQHYSYFRSPLLFYNFWVVLSINDMYTTWLVYLFESVLKVLVANVNFKLKSIYQPTYWRKKSCTSQNFLFSRVNPEELLTYALKFIGVLLTTTSLHLSRLTASALFIYLNLVRLVLKWMQSAAFSFSTISVPTLYSCFGQWYQYHLCNQEFAYFYH